MSASEEKRTIRFCPACGVAAVAGASFCVACGAALAGGATARAAAPAAAVRDQWPGLAVFAIFLVVGLALWFAVLAPDESTERLPIASKPPAGQSAPPAAPSGELPADHPPLGLPADVRDFIAGLEKQADAAPKDLAVWKRLADVQYRASQVDKQYLPKAEAAFRAVLALDAKDLDAIRGLGNVAFDRDQYPAAIEQYTRYLGLSPKDASVRTDLGTMHLYAGDAKAAIREYETVLAADPKFFQAHFNLGIAHRRGGDEAKAKAAFERARDLAPDERTKQQIVAVLTGEDSASPPPGAGEAGGSVAGGGGFQQIIERALRQHPIAGPKVVGFEWPSPTRGKVLLDGFPMEAMPEPIRVRFLDRLEKELREASTKSGTSGPVELALVDRPSGKVMATVAPK